MTEFVKSILKPFNNISTGWIVLVISLSVSLLKASWGQLGDKQYTEKKTKFVLMFKHGHIAGQVFVSVLAIMLLLIHMVEKIGLL